MIPHSDKELLNQLATGDLKAYDTIFLKYYRLLCINAFFFLKDEQEAKDLVQVFFVDFWEKGLYKKMDGDVKGYLYQSVRNRCLNVLRKRISDGKKQSLFERNHQLDVYHPEDHNRIDQTYTYIREALFDLPKQRREALQIVYLEDKKYIEAAAQMGISINSLKTHLKFGLKSLRDQIKTLKTS